MKFKPMRKLCIMFVFMEVVVVPWDYRVPKIRISTRQVDNLRNQRQVKLAYASLSSYMVLRGPNTGKICNESEMKQNN